MDVQPNVMTNVMRKQHAHGLQAHLSGMSEGIKGHQSMTVTYIACYIEPQLLQAIPEALLSNFV